MTDWKDWTGMIALLILLGMAFAGGVGYGYIHGPKQPKCPACLSTEGCEILGELGKLQLQLQQHETKMEKLSGERP